MKKHQKEDYPLEYEEYGNAGMYLFAVFSVLLMIGIIILFALFVAGGTFLVNAIIWVI